MHNDQAKDKTKNECHQFHVSLNPNKGCTQETIPRGSYQLRSLKECEYFWDSYCISGDSETSCSMSRNNPRCNHKAMGHDPDPRVVYKWPWMDREKSRQLGELIGVFDKENQERHCLTYQRQLPV